MCKGGNENKDRNLYWTSMDDTVIDCHPLCHTPADKENYRMLLPMISWKRNSIETKNVCDVCVLHTMFLAWFALKVNKIIYRNLFCLVCCGEILNKHKNKKTPITWTTYECKFRIHRVMRATSEITAFLPNHFRWFINRYRIIFTIDSNSLRTEQKHCSTNWEKKHTHNTHIHHPPFTYSRCE